uniref:Integrase catalytic domain-containing protein n=1 Tax=Strongyloides venezuelensis TaxID=75913 RepID=A0A0K0G4U5_STRVS
MHIEIGHYLSHKFLLSVDSFSGYTITQPIRNVSASEAIRAMTEIFSVTSVPLLTVSDNALCFNSDAFL